MNVLGINFSNDAAAAIVRDGSVLGASTEERFTRAKHDRRFPTSAIDFCLSRGGVALDELDAVAFFWNPGIHLQTPNWKQSGAFRHHMEYLSNVPNHLLPRMGGQVQHVDQRFQMEDGRSLRVVYVTHHIAHAAAAFFRSNFEDAAVLSVDGYGERSSTLIADAEGTNIRPVRTVNFPHSLGSVYAAVTQWLGYRANSGEGKVMGLASYGEPRFLDHFRQLLRPTEGGFEVDLGFFSYFHESPLRVSDRFIERYGAPRMPESELEQYHMDVAASLQVATEEILIHLARIARKETGRTRLCMAGGVTLNCVANTRIAAEAGFDECYFLPAASDAGTSMGAALAVSHLIEGVPRVEHPQNDYLGFEQDEETIARELKKAGVPYRTAADLTGSFAGTVAELISRGFIVGWFQGRAEFGPRALGNRSILADPRRPEMKDVLNARVKFREYFRPFAPSILAERMSEFFDGEAASPYMLRVYDTRPGCVESLPAVTHVDGGARVQSVTAAQNSRYHELISAFGDLTGVPVVLNTSFNIRGEPIVNGTTDALKCFYTTDMDFLAVGGHLLEKRPGLLDEALDGLHADGFGPLPRRA